jgi:hypothetical protein
MYLDTPIEYILAASFFSNEIYADYDLTVKGN